MATPMDIFSMILREYWVGMIYFSVFRVSLPALNVTFPIFTSLPLFT